MNTVSELEVEDVVSEKVEESSFDRLDYFNNVLNKDFVEMFMNIYKDVGKLKEFVFAMDCLTEIAASESMPSGRLLNNPDVTPHLIFTLGQTARVTKDRSLFGCAVGKTTAGLIEEFFSYEYLKLIVDFLNKTNLPFMVFTMDGVRCHLTYVPNLCSLREFAAIKFTDGLSGNEVFLPFNVSRLN